MTGGKIQRLALLEYEVVHWVTDIPRLVPNLWRRTVLLTEAKKVQFARNSGTTVDQDVSQVTI